MRPCLIHWNVMKKDSDVVAHDPELVDVTCSDYTAFKKTTDESVSDDLAVVEAAAVRVEAGTLTKTLYENICMSRGFVYNKYGVLFDAATRPMITQDVILIDWVHTLLCDGSFSCEVHLILTHSDRMLGKGFAHVRSFFGDGWALPKNSNFCKNVLNHIFDDIRHAYAENHEKLKASASELLSVYGLLRHWVLLELQGERDMEKHVNSFNACCELVDIMLSAKRGTIPMRQAADLLERAAKRHLDEHKGVYGTARIKPKHHWVFDVAEKMRWLLYVYDAFLIEKAHLRAIAVADHIENTSMYEQSVLARMMHSQVNSLRELGPQAELMGTSAPFPGFDDALVSDNLAIEGVTYSVGDFVFLDTTTPGQILACVQEGEDFFVVVHAFVLVGMRLSVHSANYTCQGARAVWLARNVSLALAWREIRPGVFTILLC